MRISDWSSDVCSSDLCSTRRRRISEAAPVAGKAAARWRVVLVDDSADDAELAMIELRHAGIDAECVRVDSEASLLSALDGPAPRLVLSDVNMPGFDGPHALAIVRERAPAARFVFLTGAIAEDATLPEADGVLPKHELHDLPDRKSLA